MISLSMGLSLCRALVDVGGWALLETKGEVSVEGEWEGDGESCLDDGDTWRC